MDFEQFFAEQSKAEEAAIARATDEQKSIVKGDYWMRAAPEYGLLIFGYVMTDEELYSSSAYEGVSEEEIAWEKENAENVYNRGYRFGRAYSTAVIDGELGDTHISTMMKITKENFEEAQSVNFDPYEIARQDWFIDLAVRQAQGY